jgi:hypothetical protein
LNSGQTPHSMRTNRTGHRFVWQVLATCLLVSLATRAQSPQTIADQFSTAERLKKPGWWPTKGNAPKDEYVGAAACARCHADIAATQKTTPMARTAMVPLDSEMLRSHDKADLSQPPYTYQMTRTAEGEVYTTTDGQQTITEPLTWAFGTGNHGQSYLFEHQGSLYETRLTYYQSSQSFGLTPNHPSTPAESLEKAIGRRISSAEAQKCFGCHTTASTVSGVFTPSKATPGVTCEVCHGPGAAHAAAEKNGFRDEGAALVVNPARLAPADSVDFCGACHRTWWDVTQDGFKGIQTLRFPAYRLEKSLCWGKGDARITCMGCHDPHQLLAKEPASYDTKCLSCHQVTGAPPKANHPGAACTVSTRDCATCHMPKYETPEMHTKFTDHMIRVIRKEAQKDTKIPD